MGKGLRAGAGINSSNRSLSGPGRESASTLREVIAILNEMQRKGDNLYVYSRMRRDEDNSNTQYQSLFDRAQGLSVQSNSAVAFVMPELLAMTRKQVKKYEQAEPELAVYAHYFDELFRQKEHILGKRKNGFWLCQQTCLQHLIISSLC